MLLTDEMGKPTWMKFEPAAFLVGTQSFSVAERGIYITMLCYQWERGGYLPVEHEKLARLCGVSLDEFENAWAVVSEKFDHDDAGYFNPRGLATLEDAVNLMERRSEAGKRGAAALHRGKRMANAQQTHAKAITRASDSSSPSQSVDECSDSSTPSPPVVLPSPEPDLPEALDTDAFRKVWTEWLAFRREHRWTTRTDWRAKQLKMLAPHGPVVAAMALEQSMAQGWQGVFPEKVNLSTPIQAAERQQAPLDREDALERLYALERLSTDEVQELATIVREGSEEEARAAWVKAQQLDYWRNPENSDRRVEEIA